MVRKVVHLGPCSSRGGMSVVIRNLLRNPPEGWREFPLLTLMGRRLLKRFLDGFIQEVN